MLCYVMFHSFRRLHSIDINSFLSDLQCSRLITNPPNLLGSLLIAYNTTLYFLLDKHAPVITIFSSRKSKSNPWFTSTLHAFKLLFVDLKTSENAPTLLSIGLCSNLFATNSLPQPYSNVQKAVLLQPSLFIF